MAELTKHQEFERWAIQNGVNIDGIEPKHFPGTGMGIAATRDIAKGEQVLFIPNNLMITPLKRSTDISARAELTARLCLEHKDPHSPHRLWLDTWPTPADLTTLPLNWPSDLQSLLPFRAQEEFQKQQQDLTLDWEAAQPLLSTVSNFRTGIGTSISYELFKYFYTIVLTRQFYRQSSPLQKRPDRIALCPFGDYFNHSPTAGHRTTGKMTHQGFEVTTLRPHTKGQQLFVAYGTHSNDDLLVGYGFLSTESEHDSVRVDDVVLPRLSEAQKQCLEEAGYLGEYTLTAAELCHRTNVALRLLLPDMKRQRWCRFVDGYDDGTADEDAVNKIAVGVLTPYGEEIEGRIRMLEDRREIGERRAQVGLLLARWRQMREMVAGCINSLQHYSQVNYLPDAFVSPASKASHAARLAPKFRSDT